MIVNKKRKVGVVVSLLVAVSLIAAMSLLVGATEGQEAMDQTAQNNSANSLLDHATLIDDENDMFVGKEVVDDTPLTATKGAQAKADATSEIESTEIVDSFAEGVIPPANMTEFVAENNITPEVIVPNGSAAIFGKTDNAGWMCSEGEDLVYQFEKYPSEIGEQTLVVGYILDGVMYPGEKFLEIKGEYKCEIEQTGEYFIYVINASSDPLALKCGNVRS